MTMLKGKYPSLERMYPGEDVGGCEPSPWEEEISRLGPSRATVLLVGGSPETKARVARALHDRSPRGHQPFVQVDCAVLQEEAVEQALFGAPSYGTISPVCHQGRPPGAVVQAERGTLYVAAIDALPLGAQPRFLRFLDETRVVRVVVSSDADFITLQSRGRFRADLAERLSLVWVDLSDRGEV
jgi:DNA-binding NtrC family response regulator